MNKHALIVVASTIGAMMMAPALAAVPQQQPPLHKGVPETSAEDFTVRKAALVQHVKDTIFRLSIEKSCVEAATTAAALDACQQGAPMAKTGDGKKQATPPAAVPEKAPATAPSLPVKK
ncbi:MAG: hypothetical protein KGL10_02835 [Alphaproteobacteria bacterium]|nr:hypothetical protein [Alphaproteobacteria bacterium]MDE2336226.1 hypothetical protein [Alphaproteobacteria bacterium]